MDRVSNSKGVGIEIVLTTPEGSIAGYFAFTSGESSIVTFLRGSGM